MALMSSPSFGKAGRCSCCLLAARGCGFKKLCNSLPTDSVCMATKVASLSFQQRAPAFPMVGTFRNCPLTVKWKSFLKKPFHDTSHPMLPSLLYFCGDWNIKEAIWPWRALFFSKGLSWLVLYQMGWFQVWILKFRLALFFFFFGK